MKIRVVGGDRRVNTQLSFESIGLLKEKETGRMCPIVDIIECDDNYGEPLNVEDGKAEEEWKRKSIPLWDESRNMTNRGDADDSSVANDLWGSCGSGDNFF